MASTRARNATRKPPLRVREQPGFVHGAARILLDTHTWLWWQAGSRHLSASTRQTISNASEVRLSVVSAWEIAIKVGLRKLSLPPNVTIESELARDGFDVLPLELSHVDALARLPALHRDPFDRMLVAQAIVEGLTIVTADDALTGYPVAIIRGMR